jgi:CheY-like chemotaxis protein
VLELQGYHVLTASNGTEGLERSDGYEGEIHLLVSDVIMPGMGGRELSEAVVRARPDIKVLFISGYMDDVLLRHGVREGEVDLLFKPFTAGEFARRVREALDGSR